MRLRDKVAIVTGAGSGIGKATAVLFSREGSKVVIAEIDGPRGEKAAAEINQNGGDALFVHADISKEVDARRITDQTMTTFGRVDVLVNNAATFVLKGFDATLEEWRHSVGVNIIGTALVTKYAVAAMKKGGGGAIAIMSSISSWIAQPDFFAYSATKAALLQMTRNMAMDLAPYRIRVNCVCPGSILTAESYRYMKRSGITLERFNVEEGGKTLLKRVGQPHEVAQAALFLVSDDASYITGTYLIVDGGYTAM